MAKSFNLQKVVKTLKKMLNLRNLMLFFLLIVLFLLYRKYLKEGFESSCENLENDIKEDKKLVLFYADWCGHCKKLKPIWDDAANEADNKMIKVNVGDGKPEQKKVMEKYNIKGFPTILMFEDGKNKGQFEKRDKESFLEYFN
jgi:thiol-disulfide isomerase/thioredoxin